MRNKIIAVLFFISIALTAVSVKFYNHLSDILHTMLRMEQDSTVITESLGNAGTSILDSIPYKTTMVKFNGSLLKLAGTRSYYNLTHGMNITTDGYNVGRYNQTTTDYEVSQVIAFKEYLDSKGIRFLYVSKPAKYIDDMYFTEQFGDATFLNKNTDVFLQRIGDAGINYLDLRENIREEGLDSMAMFYRTDHHWTVPASEWAAARIAGKLNADYGYGINLSLYDATAFQYTIYEKSWLGEQGKLVSDNYIGLEDFTVMEPAYDTDFSILSLDGQEVKRGDFGIFIDKTMYDSDEDIYDAVSWHYSYFNYPGSRIHNNQANGGKILVLGDSYDATLVPFLALGVNEVESVLVRGLKDGASVRDYVERGNYDLVILAYGQMMIGTHDDVNNDNYRLFNLE